jgi:hypothetical protein
MADQSFGMYDSRSRCWSGVEPEVGIEPTTYRLQDGCSVYTAVSTGDYRYALDLSSHSGRHDMTPTRVTSRVMTAKHSVWATLELPRFRGLRRHDRQGPVPDIEQVSGGPVRG